MRSYLKLHSAKLYLQVNENHGAELTEQEAASDASLLIASSLETTSQAITTLFRYVAADQEVFDRLRAEIDSVVAVDVDEIDPSSLTELTYLDACVHEALRIVPPAPAGTSTSIICEQ
jgi:cytochrome P450